VGAITTSIVVLGMHRSGTSCLAGMLAAAGVASAGDAVRNWDNARGHHEMLDLVRLNERVLAHSGGHWLSAPPEVRWTPEHAAERDRLLAAPAALLKDPRTLLTLPFWRASTVPFDVIAIVRHPLAVAHSLAAWRGTPLHEGLALWSAHNRVLADDRARHGYALVDFDAPRDTVIAQVVAACAAIARPVDASALAAAYEEQLVHHDAGDITDVPGLGEALQLYRRLGGGGPSARAPFPRRELAAFERCLADGVDALDHARRALSAIADAAAVLVPIVTTLIRHRAYAAARALIAEQAPRLEPGVADLLHGKVLLAMNAPALAIDHLEAACATAAPYFQARLLLAQALRAAGRHHDARTAMQAAAATALYPHGPLGTLAEWSWLDGARDQAVAEIQRAIAAAPPHRRGRLRTRRAEWLLDLGDPVAARRELEQALVEDPGYARSREVLARLPS
jgi:tetratricopeptide (TPR) repeat protein